MGTTKSTNNGNNNNNNNNSNNKFYISAALDFLFHTRPSVFSSRLNACDDISFMPMLFQTTQSQLRPFRCFQQKPLGLKLFVVTQIAAPPHYPLPQRSIACINHMSNPSPGRTSVNITFTAQQLFSKPHHPRCSLSTTKNWTTNWGTLTGILPGTLLPTTRPRMRNHGTTHLLACLHLYKDPEVPLTGANLHNHNKMSTGQFMCITSLVDHHSIIVSLLRWGKPAQPQQDVYRVVHVRVSPPSSSTTQLSSVARFQRHWDPTG